MGTEDFRFEPKLVQVTDPALAAALDRIVHLETEQQQLRDLHGALLESPFQCSSAERAVLDALRPCVEKMTPSEILGGIDDPDPLFRAFAAAVLAWREAKP